LKRKDDFAMTTLSPEVVYEHLEHLAEVDPVEGASYRQEAFEVITDETVSPQWQTAICDRLNEANHDLAISETGKKESY